MRPVRPSGSAGVSKVTVVAGSILLVVAFMGLEAPLITTHLTGFSPSE